MAGQFNAGVAYRVGKSDTPNLLIAVTIRLKCRHMTQDITMKRQHFVSGLDQLIATVMQGRTCVQISRRLGAVLHDDKDFAATGYLFWNASGAALSAIAQLWAFKLFDEDKAALTIHRILKEAEGLKHQFPHRTSAQVEAMIKMAYAKMVSSAARRKRIRDKRNNLIAHLNRQVVTNPSDFGSGYIVRWSDLLAEFDLAASILDDLCLATCNVAPSYEVVGADDMENVISLIGRCRVVPDKNAC